MQAQGVVLAGGVDIGDVHPVGIDERGGEVIHQGGQPAERVRLDDSPHLARLGPLAGRRQRHQDLGRVMGIVINDLQRAAAVSRRGRADPLEPPGRPGVGRQCRKRVGHGKAQLGGHGKYRESVEDGVGARQREVERPSLLAAVAHCCPDAAARRRPRINRPPGAARVQTVVDDTRVAVRQGRKHHPDTWMITTGDERPPRADPQGERGEGRAHGRLIGEHIGMLPLDVGDHRENGVEVRERPAVLVSLQDEHPAGAHQRVTAELSDLGTDDRRRVEARGPQHEAEHGGRGGLAVRAGDRKQVVASGQLGQPVAAAADGNPSAPGSQQLGMIVGERAGGDHHVHPDQFRGQLAGVRDSPHPHLCASGTQRVQTRSVLGVTAADRAATGKMDMGERGQPRPRDTEESDMLRVLAVHSRQ